MSCFFTSGCDKPLTVSCTNGDTRLTNGISKYDGRVEVCVNGQWGQVCHNYWSRYDAIVACKKLGYSPIGMHNFNKIYRFPLSGLK